MEYFVVLKALMNIEYKWISFQTLILWVITQNWLSTVFSGSTREKVPVKTADSVFLWIIWDTVPGKRCC